MGLRPKYRIADLNSEHRVTDLNSEHRDLKRVTDLNTGSQT
jgi:hypothetical protein